MRLEQMVALVVWNSRPIIGDSEVGPSIATLSSVYLDMAPGLDRIDGVVPQVRDPLAHQQGICAHVDCIRGLSNRKLNFLAAGARSCHAESALSQLVEVNRCRGVGHTRCRALRKAVKHCYRVVGGGGGLEAFPVDGMQ